MPSSQKLETLIAAWLAICFAFLLTDSGDAVLIYCLIAFQAALVPFLFWSKFEGRVFKWSVVHWFACAFLLWLFANVQYSPAPENSRLMLGRFSLFIVALFCVSQLNGEQWKRVFFYLLLICSIGSIWVFSEHLILQKRASGPILDPNSWASIGNLILISLFGFCLSLRQSRWWAWPVIVLLAIGVFATLSRTGLFLLVASVALIVILVWQFIDARRTVGFFVSALVFAGVIFTSVKEVSYIPLPISADHSDWSGRFSMWSAALRMAVDEPIFGVGIGTFNLHYPRYREELGSFGSFAHNDYLQFFAEGGMVMLSFALLMLGFLLVQLWFICRSLANGDRSQAEALALVIAMGSVMAHGLVNFPLYLAQIHLLFGAILARLLIIRGFVYGTRIKVDYPRLSKIGVAGISAVVVIIALSDALSHELLYSDNIPKLAELQYEQPATYFQVVSTLQAIRSENSYNRIATATMYRRLFDRAQDTEERYALGSVVAWEYQEALRINTYHMDLIIYFAQFLESNPEFMDSEQIIETPERLYQKGVELFPVSLKMIMAAVDYLEKNDRVEEAYELLIGNGLNWFNLGTQVQANYRREFVALLLERALEREDKQTLERLLNVAGVPEVKYAMDRRS